MSVSPDRKILYPIERTAKNFHDQAARLADFFLTHGQKPGWKGTKTLAEYLTGVERRLPDSQNGFFDFMRYLGYQALATEEGLAYLLQNFPREGVFELSVGAMLSDELAIHIAAALSAHKPELPLLRVKVLSFRMEEASKPHRGWPRPDMDALEKIRVTWVLS
jgi:hypothetical protein